MYLQHQQGSKVGNRYMLGVVLAESRLQGLLHIVVSQQWPPSSYRAYAEGCRRSSQSLDTSLADWMKACEGGG